LRLWMNAMQPGAGEGGAAADKRFSAPEWDELPVFRYFRDSYLLTSKMMMEAVEEANLDVKTKQRMRFFMRQYLDAAAPSNYLMDLQPENSLVRYGTEQGHTVFMVSWRNVKERQAKVTWDEYIASLIAALEETKRIAKSPTINALGFCIGGTLLAAALAVLE